MLSVPTLWIVFTVNFLALGVVWTYVARSYPNLEAARFWAAATFIAAAGAAVSMLRNFVDPNEVRLLLVPRACVLWARSGSYRDPSAYLDEEQRLWSGDPRILGDTGILGALKKKAFMHTQRGQYAWPWWRTADLGR